MNERASTYPPTTFPIDSRFPPSSSFATNELSPSQSIRGYAGGQTIATRQQFKIMKHILYALILLLALTPWARSQPISLVRAAELTTSFMEGTKINGKPISEFFSITALRRIPDPESIGPATVTWRVDLEETQLERTNEEMRVLVLVDGKRYRRVLEIRNDQTVAMGKVFAEPRQRIVRPRIVPPPK